MDNNIIDQFQFPEYETTGKIECTDFVDIDRAVFSFIGRIVNSMHVEDTSRKENREFVSFIKKPLKDRLFLGYYETPNDFLQSLLSKSKPNNLNNVRDVVPSMYVSRERSISFCDGSDYVDIPNHSQLCLTETGKPYANVNKSFAKLNYVLNCLAWNKSTSDRMAIPILMWLRNRKKHTTAGGTANSMVSFKTRAKLAGTSIELGIEINTPDAAIAGMIDIPQDSSRLYGYTFTFEVIAEVYEAVFIDDKTINVQFAVEAIDEQY